MAQLINWAARCSLGLLLLGSAAACGSGSAQAGDTVTVTVPPSLPVSSPPVSSGSAPGPSGASTASPSGSASTAATRLNGTCDSLLPDYLVSQELGGAQLGGQTAFVVGVPDKTIGRLSTINCRYGVTGTGAKAAPKIEIGVSLYATPAQAATRINATVDDYKAHGADSADATIEGSTGTQLTGGVGAGYDVPLLVVASGRRTVAVGFAPTAVKGADPAQASAKLAALALKRTAG